MRTRGRRRFRMGLAAVLAVVAVLALGPAGTSAAPGENAVVHWSGIAASAIIVGPRPPASSSVLGGMVHGAMYDAVAAIEGGLEPFATGVTAPPGASADAAVAQAARDVLVARVPGQAATVQTAYDAFMASIPDGPAKDGGKAVGVAAAAGMLAMRTGDHFDDVVPYVQPTPGPGVFEPIAPTPPVDVKLPLVRPFTYDSQSDYRPSRPGRADEQALRAGRGRGAGVRPHQQHRADSGCRPRPSASTPSRRSSSSTATLRELADRPRARLARVCTAAGLRERRDRGHDDRLLGGEVPLHVLASEPRDPAGRHGREPVHLAGA